MKKITFLAALCCLAFTSNAQNQNTSAANPVEIATSDEAGQELVASINGIDVYYSSIEVSGNTLLNIQFVNTGDETVTFAWEIKKDAMTFNSRQSFTIEPGKSFDQNGAIEIKGTTDLSEYSISLTIK